MRKLLALILALLMLASTLISCGNTEDLNNGSQSLLDSGFQGSFGSGSGTNIQSMKPTDKYGQEKFTSAVPTELDFDDDSTESSFDKETGNNTNNNTNNSTGTSHTCVDANKDHICDTCNGYVGTHEDKAGDNAHTCAYCGKTAGTCVDSDKNTVCDLCGAKCQSVGLEYLVNIDGTTCTIMGMGTCTDTNLFIPSKMGEFTVTAIADNAFKGKNIKSVTIPDSVKSIGEWAFYSSALTSITLGSGVESIGERAFSECSFLTGIVIPNSTKTIGDWAFDNSGLTSITLGSGITSIGFCAFDDCYKLFEVINKSNLKITAGSDSNGFIAKYALEVHNGESKIKKVNDYIFYTTGGVNYLCGYVGTSKELVLPDKYNNQNYKIYKYAFYNSKITSIVISSGVVGIGANAFSECGSLTSAEFKTTSGWSVGGTAAGANVISNKSTVATYLKDTYKDKEWTRS